VAGGPDLFVVCKSCGSEVSPYITECPYCGTRLRKRAPKLTREGRSAEPRLAAPARPARPSLGRLRRGEIPGIRFERRPYATLALVLVPIAATLAWRAGAFSLLDTAIIGRLHGDWWRVFTSLAVYSNTGHEFAALLGTALFGWLLERRHGVVVTLVVGLAGGAVGMLLAATLEVNPIAVGGQGVALALLAAWAVPSLLALRHGRDVDADMLGALVFAVVLLLLPVAVEDADAVAGVGGAAVGLLLGPLVMQAGDRLP
jgi:membrane associated rhomboid family serine protease